MKIFIDTANIDEIKRSNEWGVIDGVTTNPTLVAKEGKEFNQGVAYLDDGTMVVVEEARKLLGQTLNVAVTSVLQTSAGRMIFGKTDDNPKSHKA